VLPPWPGAGGGPTPRARDVVYSARRAEDAGFDSVWVSDHFLYEPYVDFAAVDVAFPDDFRGVRVGAWECWSLLAALAVASERLTLGTLVTNTGFRNPALLARMIDTVDALSGGRLVAGLGAGDFATEHQAFGYPFERRVSRFEEALTIIHPLLRGETVTRTGEFYRTDGAVLMPRGERTRGPPLLIGSLRGGPRMLRLIARYADHWNCMLPFQESSPAAFDAAWAPARAACLRHGRDPATLARNVTVGVCLPGGAWPLPGARPLTGSPAALLPCFREFAARGIETLTLVIEPWSDASLAAFAEVAAALRD
jgi:alkanesulfonate monooxygenase SsuD/methylene tetrahydromethanopterin reductase-like flavin-dependent oxidoreductase (luciferase family)